MICTSQSGWPGASFPQWVPVYVEEAGDRAEAGPYFEVGLVVCGTQLLSPLSMDTQPNGSSKPMPLGLSDPQYAARRKRMFEFLIRVCALGCVTLLKHLATAY